MYKERINKLVAAIVSGSDSISGDLGCVEEAIDLALRYVQKVAMMQRKASVEKKRLDAEVYRAEMTEIDKQRPLRTTP